MEGSLIVWLLARFHLKKWVAEVCAIALFAIIVGGLVWHWHHATFAAGIQHQKDDDAQALAAWQKKASDETAKNQQRADTAEKANATEHAAFTQYVADHPLHGSLCHKPGPATTVPSTTADNGQHGSPTAATGSVQPVLDGDTGGEADQLGMLQAGFARCDALSAQVREYQAR